MDFLELALLVPALIWLVVFCLRGWTLPGVAALLLVINCFGAPFLSLDTPAGTLTLDRLLIAVLLACHVAQRLWGVAEPKPYTRTEAWLIIGFLVLLTVSTFTHDRSQFHPPKDVPPTWRLLAGYWIPFVIYAISRQTKLSEGNLTWLLWAMFGFGVYLAITGVCEYARAWSLVYPKYIADPKLGIHFGRARGPMLHSPTLGMYLGACLYAGWLLLPRLSRGGKLVIAALTPLFLVCVYCTLTRMCWLGVGAGLVVVLYFMLAPRWRVPVLGSLCVASCVGLVANWEKFMAFKREFSASETRDSAELRTVFAYVSWQMFLDRPLLGFGFGQFPYAKLPYLADRSTDLKLESIRIVAHHNTYLSLLVEVGLVGMTLYLALTGLWCWQAWQLARSRAAPAWAQAYGVLSLATMGPWIAETIFRDCSYTSHDNGLMFCLTAIVSGLHAMFLGRDRSRETERRGAEGRPRAVAAAG